MNRLERIDPAQIDTPREHRFTVAEVRALYECGAFPETLDVELVAGRIVELPPETPTHFHGLTGISEFFLRALLARQETLAGLWFYTKPTLLFGANDYAEPDGLVARRVPRTRLPGPADVVLALETTVSRRDYDLGDKALRYARAGIAELWVYEPEAPKLTVHRDPGADGYRSVAAFDPGQPVAPLFAPDLTFDLSTLA